MKKLLRAIQGNDNSCKKKPYPTEDAAREMLPILQAKGHKVRGVHWCLEHDAWHVTSSK